jgi:hypothetical protein
MKINEKALSLSFAILIGLLSVVLRLSTFGFFYLIGMLSVLIFGILHLLFLINFNRYFQFLKLWQKIMAWISFLSFPMIFLFQFDLEEYRDAFYVYEHLIGEQKNNFEYYAFYIAVIFGIIYILNFIIWNLKINTK